LTSFQRIEVTNNLIGKGDVLSKVLESDAEKIRKTLEGIDREAFEGAVASIVNAKNIYILGVRSSSSLASFLDHSLRMIFDNVRRVQTASGAEVFEQMLSVGEGDAVIAISFPRYSKRIIKATEYAHKSGADVVCLTDSVESPLAASADQLLVAQSDMASFVDSLVAPLSVINALVVAVSRVRQEQVTERLRHLEVLWDEYDIYDKTQQ
ncbi:MAG: MurR/RpiR family transcriptional regulator, partial [Clostridia bacterium]|nr:MurR/RpiR family transcriptional regulator [Clostridia bacterium]